MDITIEQTNNAIIYVENVYQGDLPEDSLQLTESIPWTSWMKTWLYSLSEITELAQDCELSLRLGSDRQIQSLNYQYRSFLWIRHNNRQEHKNTP